MNETSPAATGRDGRHLRAEASRLRIRSALIDMVEAGVTAPTAEQVAQRAGVSLRTVFRHYAEVENLYLELGRIMAERVRPFLAAKPNPATDYDPLWHSIDRRAELFETVMPIKAALDAHRHRSAAIKEQDRHLRRLSRATLHRALRPSERADRELALLLETLLSIDTWRRLREAGLNQAETARLLRRAAAKLTDRSD